MINMLVIIRGITFTAGKTGNRILLIGSCIVSYPSSVPELMPLPQPDSG